MKQSIKEYIKELENNKKSMANKTNEILIKIKFFQHERLIHLIVTSFVGICAVLFLLGSLAFENIGLIILFIITFLLFVPYIFYYYTLENGVQKLYDLYFEILNQEKK